MVIVAVFSDFLNQFIEVYLGLNVCKAHPCPVGLTDLSEVLYYSVFNSSEHGNSLVSFLM